MKSKFSQRAFLLLLIPAVLAFYVKDSAPAKITGFSSPESIISDGKNFYVSNVGKELDPTTKDGDGFISKLQKNGQIKELKFIQGLDAPKGMAIVGKTLFVADINKVKGFDLSSGKQVFIVDFEKEHLTFLNDLVTGESNKLFVSATDIGVVFEIDVQTKRYTEVKFSEAVTGPNGLHYDVKSKTLYMVSFAEKGKVYKAEKKDRSYLISVICEETGNYDGIYFSGNTLVVSDWTSGSLKKIDLQTRKTVQLTFPDPHDFSGPADFYYDALSGSIWIPEMQTGIIWKMNLSL